MTRTALLLALVLGVPACTAVSNPSPATGDPAGAAQDKPAAADDEADLGRDLQEARIELTATELSVDKRRRDSTHEIEKAERQVEAARHAQKVFLEIETPLEVDELRLDLDRDRGRLDDQRAELVELEAMYAAEEFAKTTKELVIQRGRRQVAHAERDLELTVRRARQKEIQRERRTIELARELSDAEFGLAGARIDAQKLGIDVDLELRRARNKIADLEKKIAAKQKAKTDAAKTEQP